MGGLFSKKMLKIELAATDANGLAEIIQLGIDKGWFEVATGIDSNNRITQGTLTEEQYARLKPKGGGHFPQIFRVTNEGKLAAEGIIES